MNLSEIFTTILSALAGTLVSSVVAKVFIERSLTDLEAALKMCYEIKEDLAVIRVKIESIPDIQRSVGQHETKLALIKELSQRDKLCPLHKLD